MSGGRVRLISPTLLFTSSEMAIWSAPGWARIERPAMGWPLQWSRFFSFSAPMRTSATSPRWMVAPPLERTTIFRKSSTLESPVLSCTESMVVFPSREPAGRSAFSRRKADRTSATVRPRAANLPGSTRMRMAYLRSPQMSTSATPGIVCKSSWIRSDSSETPNKPRVGLCTVSSTMGLLLASALETTGGSRLSGRFERARETRSRTSLAARSRSTPSWNSTETRAEPSLL